MGEVSIFCASLVGAGLGFLWFNAPPAKIFMGDTGSLATGGAIGAVSVMTRNEFIFAIAGGLFGGYFAMKFGTMITLFIGALIASLSNLLFCPNNDFLTYYNFFI